MLFPSTIFIFGFAPIAILGYWLIKGDKWRRAWLTLASYFFYAYGSRLFLGYNAWMLVILLLVSSLVDYFAGLGMATNDDNPRIRRRWFLSSIVVSLSFLGFFKYYMLISGTIDNAIVHLGWVDIFPRWEIILPIGISFFTFNSMSYAIDVYRRDVKPTRDIIEYSTFIALFPHLIAGPIVRYRQICDTLRDLPKRFTNEHLNLGLFFFGLGLVKKVLIADRIAYYINPMFADYMQLKPVEAWLAMFGYSLQLYFDFAGYSLMAIGLAQLLGIHFPQNFNSPYRAVSISDFWRRWHMSLSSWLKDYLYIPLGGRDNRFIALTLTMFLGGLWHGPNWTFAAWGLYHGILLQLHHMLKNVPWIPRNPVYARIGTFLLVSIGWVFFRSPNFGIAMSLFGKMFDIPGLLQPVTLQPALVIGVIVAMAWAMLAPNAWELVRDRQVEPRRSWAVALGILSAICILLLSETGPFLYFQF
jgi:alginate O-acetyltransferase complex protein AlgI